MHFSDSLKSILSTTPRHLKALTEIGVTTVGDLLHYFPRRHVDLSVLREPSEIEINTENTVAGTLAEFRSIHTKLGKVLISGKLIGREGGVLDLVWFNQTWVTKQLLNGDEIVVTGRVQMNGRRHQMVVNRFEKVGGEMLHAGRLVPIYRTHGRLITSKWLREKIHPLLNVAADLPDSLPTDILERQDLAPLAAAVKEIHFPDSAETWEQARQRLAFDELFFLQLSALRRRLDWQLASAGSGVPLARHTAVEDEFRRALPFAFTHAQTKATDEILTDLTRDVPMNRLLEGDVGSGKTVVAALAIFVAIRAGHQAALLAPTEILASQHFKNFLKILHPLGIHAELLTGSTPASQKKEIAGKLKAGQLDVVVGTHALLEEKIQFKSLALAVIDEQHRFGVEQRTLLKKEGTPHVLAMTATPIPRTLALTIFGDQDVSIIDALPPGRTPIITRVVPPTKRLDSYRWIESEVGKGRQVFVVCPLIEESTESEAKSAKAEFTRLQTDIFPQLKLGLLHGKMKPREKDAVMAEFARGAIQILVATTVIEVGIDVPNATIMLIEGADRFGLAQLHQLRGRVGRGAHQSYCFLFPSEKDKPTDEEERVEMKRAEMAAIERLNAMVEVSDGFRLAEIDLRLRGPGEVFGTRQSGVPDFRMARFSDVDLIRRSRDEAERLLREDPHLLQHPTLAIRLATIETPSDS